MKKRHLSTLLVGLLLLLIPYRSALGADPDWTPVGPGIDYREYHLSAPNNVYVARMQVANPQTTLETSIAQGKLSSGLETVKGMASRYDRAINYWGQQWGNRNQVVVAINGSYKDPNAEIPDRGMVHSGWYAKRFTDLESGSGFAWQLDRSYFIGECVYHDLNEQLVSFISSTTTISITDVNMPRLDDQLILYTPQWDRDTLTDDSGIEVLVELSRPALLIPSPNFVRGWVRAVHDGQGATPISFNSVVLSASGSKAEFLRSLNLQPGDEVRISQEISNCKPKGPDWTKTYASLGGAFYFLKNSLIQDSSDPGATVRAPRTAITYNDQYIYFIVVDGRDPNWSVGMTIHELAVFARDTLSSTYGIAEDGGGSSTMVVNGEVKNNTFCNNVFCARKVFVPLTMRAETALQRNPYSSTTGSAPLSPQESGLERSSANRVLAPESQVARAVVNGIMMVAVEPITYTQTYSPSQMVTTTTNAELRLGPGDNYAILTNVPAQTHGIIVDSINHLNGVLAKGANWWQVNFDGTVGWLREDNLSPIP